MERWWGSGSLQAGPIERGRVDCSLRGDFVRRTLIFTYNATNALLFFFSRASENCVNSLNILTCMWHVFTCYLIYVSIGHIFPLFLFTSRIRFILS